MKKPTNEAQAIEKMVWSWVPIAFLGIVVFLLMFWTGIALGVWIMAKVILAGWLL